MVKFLAKRWLELKKRSYLKRKIYRKRKRDVPVEKARHFLCIQMNAIGDAIMTQPAWSALKSTLPDARVDLLCRPHIAPLFETDPSLYSILPCENRRYRSWLFKNGKEVKRLVRGDNYDVLIDFTGLPLTAALCADKAAPPSVGFQRFFNIAGGKVDLGFCYDKNVPYSENVAIRELLLQLVAPWDSNANEKLAPTLRLSNKAIEKADKLMGDMGLKKKAFMVLHPGGKWLPKRWPICHWKELSRKIVKEFDLRVLILGSEEDKPFVGGILEGLGSNGTMLLITDEIDVTPSIISEAALCVCNDSAAMHIAAAVGTESIALFGPVFPSRSAPMEEEGCNILYDDMFCSPCTLYYSRERCRRGINYCMYSIKPEKVVKKMEEILCK